MLTTHTVLWRALTAVAVLIAVAVGTRDAGAAVPAHGRAWELVNPPDPNAAFPGATNGIAPNGDRVGYITVGAPPGADGGSFATANVAVRTPLGWTGRPITPPYSVGNLTFAAPAPVAADAGMSSWIWKSTFALTPGGPVSPNTGLYSRGSTGPATLLADAGSTSFEFSGASADARQIVFQTGNRLLPADVRPGGIQVYEVTDAGLRLVGVDSGGAPLSDCGAMVGSDSYPPNPISGDARRIFLSSPGPLCSSAAVKRIYLREDGETTEVSASRCTRVAPACNAASDVRFMGATPTGSVAFVATSQQMTDDDLDSGQDLYRYEAADGALTRVSSGPPGVVADVRATAAYPSHDGSRVYFVANGALVPGKGVDGSPNIYVSDDQGLRFVATVQATDSWAQPAMRTSRREDVQTTPDGTRLVFMTTVALTADDTDTAKDVYLYDASDATLSRISGAAGTGNGAFDASIAQNSSDYGYEQLSTHPPRSLSDDGRHVFFKTDQSLTPEDVNGTTDVYEWADGDLGLVSSGAPHASFRYGTASADGRSVFFTTDESLTPDDDDQGDPDLYVARTGGGFPPPEQPPAVCGDECSPRPIVRISRPVPASVGFRAVAAPGRFRVLRVSAAARRRMAISGWLSLRVQIGAPGRIVARAMARVGRGTRMVAYGEVSVARAGIARLRLRLRPAARRRLGDGRTLRVRVVLRRSRPNRVAAVPLTLEPPR